MPNDLDVALFAKAREEVRIRESNCRARQDEYGKGLHAAYRAVLDLISEDDWIRDALNDASDEAAALLAKITAMRPNMGGTLQLQNEDTVRIVRALLDEHTRLTTAVERLTQSNAKWGLKPRREE